MEQDKIYKSSYIQRALQGEYNPFRPNILVINDHYIEYRKRNWHLISEDSQTFHFQNIVGVDVDKHLFGATLNIATTGNPKIKVFGWSKKIANEIKQECLKNIAKNTQRGTTEALADAIATAVNKSGGSGQASVADELKKFKELLDNGIITQEEYDAQKSKLLNK